jgi:hypothetical protein
VDEVWYPELGVIAGGGQAGYQRAAGIVDRLRSGREVEGDGPTWRATYLDFEDREAALEALETDLDAIDRGWSDVLTIR